MTSIYEIREAAKVVKPLRGSAIRLIVQIAM